jgi:electron transfer flavoprotein alpha subunit
MRKVLVLVELARGGVDDSAWELAAAARGLAAPGEGGCRVAAVLLGSGVAPLAKELARRFDEVFHFDDPLLAVPDGEVFGALLAALIRREQPWATLIPHTNNGMDLAPGLSVRVGVPLLADCQELQAQGDGLAAVRVVYGGKVQARIRAAASPAGFMATVRPGSFAALEEEREAPGTIRQETVPPGLSPRRRFLRTLERDPGEVDISQAERLVAVGRGVGEEENLEAVRSLARALGAELACSRPVVDKRWLPKSRQVGTSGATVKPKLYLALGISGSFQHLGGIKGRPLLAAVNKDPRAPIFGVADVGIVGDLMEIGPLLEEKIRALKG